jgi:hypothetical protein
MQFIPATGRRYGLFTWRDLHDPVQSIDAAARHVFFVVSLDSSSDFVLAYLVEQFDNLLDWLVWATLST